MGSDLTLASIDGHPAPVEARLLAKTVLTATVRTEPRDQGVALPHALVAVSPSPAAAISRAAAIGAHPGVVGLQRMPRRIFDQGKTETCVSCALAGAMEVWNSKNPALGPMFHYHVTRFINGGADAKGGLVPLSALETLTEQGICREADHPSVFDESRAAVRPSETAFADALTRRIERVGLSFPYDEVVGPSRAVEIRRHIRADHPIVIVFTLPMGYPNSFLNEAHEWLDERSPQPSRSRHCVLVVAYDDLRGAGRGAVRIVDSQGSSRFDHGMWWMAYRILDSVLVHQVYALT